LAEKRDSKTMAIKKTLTAKKEEPKSKRYLTVADLRQRWGNVSQMFVERRLQHDPNFPRPMKFPGGRLRLFDEEEIEAYERMAVTGRAVKD
jgi:hypothetical protein